MDLATHVIEKLVLEIMSQRESGIAIFRTNACAQMLFKFIVMKYVHNTKAKMTLENACQHINP